MFCLQSVFWFAKWVWGLFQRTAVEDREREQMLGFCQVLMSVDVRFFQSEKSIIKVLRTAKGSIRGLGTRMGRGLRTHL